MKPIDIKFKDRDTEYRYDTFIQVQQLENYNDIVYINCNDNELYYLPDTLPSSLQKLNCGGNFMTSLPDTLPNSLQQLYCYKNRLTSLPDTLPCSLQTLVCYENELTSLPEHLPNSLQKLHCYENELTSLPEHLPNSLQILRCSYNKLTSLPEHLPNSLQTLYCYENQLTSLPEHLPNSLQTLRCSYNKLTSLPEHLPDSLQELDYYKNKLTSLPEHLPNSLQVLKCSSNKLNSLLEHLPNSLQTLYCYENKLTSLPNSIIHCRNLRYFNIDNNEIEYIPPHITRFLNRLKNNAKDIAVYNDGQNVHNHQIQQSIRDSIYSVMSSKPILAIDETVAEIIKSSILTEPTKRLIMEYCGDDSIHSVLGIRFKELLTSVWDIIRSHTNKNDILAILNDEINDANCKCFTGRMSRLINCLNGFDDRVNITIADNSQIGNIIVIVKERLVKENKYSVSHHKESVREELEERGYPSETIDEWLQYIE